MTRHVRLEPEADAEYRRAGRWYEEHRAGLGLEFFDAVDAAIAHVAGFPAAGQRVPGTPRELDDRRRPGYWQTRAR